MFSTLQRTIPDMKDKDAKKNQVPKGGRIIGGRQSSHHSFYSITNKLSSYDETVEYPKGFVNVGNTCYANATLQCLLSTALSDALLDPNTLPLFRKYSSNPNILAMGSGSVSSEDGISVGTSKSKKRIGPGGNEHSYEGIQLDIMAMGSESLDSEDGLGVITLKNKNGICPEGNEKSFEGLHDNCEWLMEELTSITEDYLGRHQFVRPSPGWSLYQSDPIEKNAVNPGNITRFPDRLSSCLRPYKQEDAHEFLRGLLSTLMKHGKNRQLSSLFDGLLESAVTCGNCGKVSMTRDRYMDLSLDIQHPRIQTLEQALLNYTSSEVLSGENSVYCRKCKTKQMATKGLRLATAPSILVCHLKQYTFDAYGRLTRLHKKIRFPMQLEIGDYMSHLNNARPPTYGLRGMLVHRGHTCASGHYVAFVLRKGEWFECNDSVVTKVDQEVVLSQRGYILIYEVAEMREQTHSSPKGSTTTPSAVPATTYNDSERHNDNTLFKFFLDAETQLFTCLEKMACGRPCTMDELEDKDDLIFVTPSTVVEVKCTTSKGSLPAVHSEQRRHSFGGIEPEMDREEDSSPGPGMSHSQSMHIRAKSTVDLVALGMHGDKGTISSGLGSRHSYALPSQTNLSGASRSSMALPDSTRSSGRVSGVAPPSKLQLQRVPLAAMSVNVRELPPLPKQSLRSSLQKKKGRVVQ